MKKQRQVTKLERAKQERGSKETSKNKHYYTYLVDDVGKEYPLDYIATSPIFARQFFREEAKIRGMKFVETNVRQYQ